MSSSRDELQSVFNKFEQLTSSLSEEECFKLLTMFQNVLNVFSRSSDENEMDEDYEEYEDVEDGQGYEDVAEHVEEDYEDLQTIEEEAYGEESEPQETPLVITAEMHARFKEILTYIGEKLYQQGRAAICLFLRYGPITHNAILVPHFKNALTSIGVYLTNDELRMVFKLFGAEVTVPETGRLEYAILFKQFIEYTEALFAKSSKSSQSDAFATVMVKRAELAQKHLEEEIARKAIRLPFTSRLHTAVKVMRDHLYSRDLPLPHLFKIINQGAGYITTYQAVESLPKYGFPLNVVSAEELSIHFDELPTITPGQLTYKEFTAFIQDTDEVIPDEPPARHILTDQGVVNVLVKLNSMPVRQHFKQIDEDVDGLVSIDEVVYDMTHLGLGEAAKNPALPAFISSFSNKQPGFLCYSEYLQFINARVGPLTQPAVPQPVVLVDVPISSTPSEVVHIIHQHIKTGISIESVFKNLCQHNTTRITEADFWHALTICGFVIEKDLSTALFVFLGPQVIEDSDETNEDDMAEFTHPTERLPTLDYREAALTFIHPNRNPRIAAGKSNTGLGGLDNVPLGSGIDRLSSEFFTNTVNDKQREVSKVKFAHTHKFDHEDEVSRDEEFARTRSMNADRRVSQFNKSSVDLSDLKPGDVIITPSFGSSRKSGSSSHLLSSTINFEQDHGGSTPRKPMRSTLTAPKAHIQIGMDGHTPIVANNPVHKSNSDVFNQSDDPNVSVQKRMLKLPHTPHKALSSSVSFNQQDFEPFVPTRARIAPPGGHSSMSQTLAHNEGLGDPLTISAELGSRRDVKHRPSDSLSLQFDVDQSLSESKNMTIGDHTRKYFSPSKHAHVRSSIGRDHQPIEEPIVPRPVSRLTETSLNGEAIYDGSDDALVARMDALVMEGVVQPKNNVSNELVAEVKSMLSKEVYAQGKVKKLFLEWSGGNNILYKQQLIDGAHGLFVIIEPEVADVLVKPVDRDGKGGVTFGEFVRLLASSQQS